MTKIDNPQFDGEVAAGVRSCIERLNHPTLSIAAARFVIYGDGGYEVTVTRLPKIAPHQGSTPAPHHSA